MKTTLDLKDELVKQAKQYAKRAGRPFRAVVEEGLRLVLAETPATSEYDLPDLSVGDPTAADPLEMLSWQDLRQEIYGFSVDRN